MGIIERILRLRGIDLVTTRSREERVRLLAERIAISSIEGGGISNIRAALGGDDGDLDELAEALTRTDAVMNAQSYKIQIKGTPVGSAPEKYRKLWDGVQMMAIKGDSVGDFDPLTHAEVSGRGEVYIVSSRQAVQALREKSPEAARWFEKNFKIPFLSFKVEEAEEI